MKFAIYDLRFAVALFEKFRRGSGLKTKIVNRKS